MRRQGWPFAYLSRLEGRFVRWLLAYRGSGFSCCILIAGALYGLYRGCSFTFFPQLPAPWEDMLWTLGKVTAALLAAAVGHCVLLALAACSIDMRRALMKVTAILAEIPSLCLLGFFCAVLPPFWSVAGLASFSLLTRSVHATLKAGTGVPSGFLKTARALRLSRWQSFWRLHMPFAFPELVRAVLRDLPDFWLQILGGELLLSLFLPHTSPGLGQALFSAIQTGSRLNGCGVLALMLVLILLVQHGLVSPLRGHGRHYAVCDLTQVRQNRHEDRPVSWWKRYISGLSGAVLAAVLLSYGFWGVPGPLSALAVAILLVGGFWYLCGGLLLGLSEKTKSRLQGYCLTGALFPVFLFCLILPLSIPAIIVPSLAVMGMSGWTFLQYDSTSSGGKFVMMGRYLRLPLLSSWRDVRFPLLCPALLQAGVVALPFFWDNVYLAALLKQGTLHLSILQTHAYGMQGILLCLMTLLAVSVRWGIFMPLQERMAHRYRI